MRNWLSIILIFGMLWSCTSSNESKSNLSPKEKEKKSTLVKEVMEVHDEAMPWMEQIHFLKKKLNHKLDSIESDSLQSVLVNAALELDSADEAMMGWMRQYREPSDTTEYKSAREYLLAQKREIEKVKTQMNLAIENAKRLVK